MDNDNLQELIERIWNNPAAVFGCDFKDGTTYKPNLRGGQYDENGKIRLKRTPHSIFVYYNGDSREGDKIFDYLSRYHLNTSGKGETIAECARIYGVTLEMSEEKKQKLKLSALAAEVAPSLVSSLSENPTGAAGAYLSEKRGFSPDGEHFGELSDKSIKRVKTWLSSHNIEYTDDDLKALGVTEERARQGYNLVIPYKVNGRVVGLVYRNTNPDVANKDRYRYSEKLGRGGYCDRLTYGKPAVMVEGQFDALRLMSAGVENVIAMGGATIGDEIKDLLNAYNVEQVVYIPDRQYNEQGKRETKLIGDAIRSIQATTDVNGNRIIKRLSIADIPEPVGVASLNNYKIDADDYGREQGTDALRWLIQNDNAWWGYELQALEQWAKDCGSLNQWEFIKRFKDIYNRCADPMEREQIRQDIDKAKIEGVEVYELCGITPTSLKEQSEINRLTQFTNSMKAGNSALKRAIDEGADPAKVAPILAAMNDALSNDTRDEWDRQINATFEDELKEIQEPHDTIRTKWELGDIVKTQGNNSFEPPVTVFRHYEYIEYYPADITVYCASTSHGKTTILLQSALDMIQRTGKTFLYVSCEEIQRQLLERVLNMYITIPTTDTGRDDNNKYCFITGTRKRTIKAAIKEVATMGGYCPEEYAILYNKEQERTGGKIWVPTEEHPTPPNFENLSRRINEGVRLYGENVDPRLKLIHTDGSAESIAENIRHFFEWYREKGIEIGGVFVDYMQLLSSDNNSHTRHDELKDVCKVLKECAKSTQLPVIIAAQLNREAIRPTQTGGGLDNVTVANIGEGADIERIAHDVFLIWQVGKTKTDYYTKNVFPTTKDEKGKPTPDYTKEPKQVLDYTKMGDRSRRIFKKTGNEQIELKADYIYIEQLKARDGKTGGWGLFPFNGEQGQIGTIDTEMMGL